MILQLAVTVLILTLPLAFEVPRQGQHQGAWDVLVLHDDLTRFRICYVSYLQPKTPDDEQLFDL